MKIKLNNIVPVLRMNHWTHTSVAGNHLVDVRSWFCVCTVFIMKNQFMCDIHIKRHPILQHHSKSSNILYWYWRTMPEATFSLFWIRRWLEEKEAVGQWRALSCEVMRYYGKSGSVLMSFFGSSRLLLELRVLWKTQFKFDSLDRRLCRTNAMEVRY